ncbi:MAG: SO_0444 family Cu/Zn efflux transporter [Planctomycetota bacterium]
MIPLLTEFWATLAAMAPWLLLGFLAAGVLSVWFPPGWIERQLGRGGVRPVVKAAVFGVPLPLCSCGVIPVGAGLYRRGASRGASSSFLLSTPQTGVDSIAATYALMGPVFAVVRPVVALVTGVVGGWLIDLVTRHEARDEAVEAQGCGSSCCGGKAEAAGGKWRRAVRYALVTLPADLVGSLTLGLVVAAALTAWLPADVFGPYLGGGLVAMLAAVVVGAPLYVCATASIPVGLGLLAVGASPGAVLAFLIAGPATNAATVAVTWRVMGRTTGLIYLGTVLVAAVGSGMLLDVLFTAESLRLPAAVSPGHDHESLTWYGHAAAAALAALLGYAGWVRLRRPWRGRSLGSSAKPQAALP